MPGKHKNNTISFRPTEWERIMIEERANMSGLTKKDFIARSCIYSNICVVGDKKNIQKIVDSVEDMIYTVKEISNGLTTDRFPLSEKTFCEMEMRYIAMCITLVEILDGASYLFEKRESRASSVLEKKGRLEELLATIDSDYQNGD